MNNIRISANTPPNFTITPSSVTVTIRGTDSAPDFGTGSVTAKSYTAGTAITEFQVPAATGGNGAITYTASGLPAGLVFDADGTGSCPGTEPREVCGTPTGATSGAQTVTITAADADSNTASSDEDTLTFTVSVAATAGVAITTTPAALTESTLHGATVALTLNNTTFAAGAPAAGAGAFELVTTIPNLSIAQVSGVSAGGATATLTLGFTGDFRGLPTLEVRVPAASHTGSGALTSNAATVTADAGVTVSEASLSLNEAPGTNNANRDTYTVVLDKPFPNCTGVEVAASSDNADVTVTPAGRQFSGTVPARLWNVAQTFTVTAGQDDDGADDAATISHSINVNCDADGYPVTLAISSVSVAVDDDETPGVTIDADPSTPAVDSGPLALTEGHAMDAAKDWTVRLATQPTQTVTVTLTSADTGAVTIDDTDGNTNGVQNTLTFTTSNWSTAQTVTARAADDADATNESVSLTAATSTATASEYESSEGVSASFTATVTDDDALAAPGSVTATAQVRALRIGWGAVTGADGYKVQWKSGQEVYDPAEREAATTGTAHTVDNLAAGTAYTVRVIPTRTGANDGPASAEATGTPLAVPTLAIDGPSVAEGDSGTATLTFTVDLSHASQHQVTVGYADAGTGTATAGASGAAGADYVTLAAGTLTIAAGDTRRTVDVTVAGDATDEPNETVVVTLSGPVNATLATATGTGTITDDDATPTVTLALTASSIGESGASNVTTVSAALNRPSSAAMTVTVSASPGAGTDFTLSSAYTLTLAAGATTSTGVVTITATDDDTDSPDKQVTVSGAVAAATVGGSAVANPSSVTLTITDDDATPTVTLALDPASISEEGGVSTVTAALDHPSSAAMTVTVAAAAGTGAVAADFSLGTATTLTLAAGATASTGAVTVTATGNAVDTDDKEVTVSGTVAAATVGGSAVANPAARTLTITDDDTAGITVSPAAATAAATTTLRTTEAGGQATFTAAPASEPTGDVVIAVASSDTGEGTVSPSSLTFTAADWATAQTVTLTGVDDSPTPQNPNPATGARPWTIFLTVNQTSTADGNYDALSAVTVHAINADDELGLSVGSVTGQATEGGGTSTFTVALLTQPSEAVTVAVSSRDASEGRASPSSMTFSTSNWNVNRTVTVTGLNDDVDDGDVPWAVRLDPSSGDGDYGGLANVDVAVTTTDDDTAALTVSPTPSSTQRLQTTEGGGQATFTVRLATEPTGNVVLNVASAITTEGTVSASSLTFTASNWDTAQTVTLTGANDDVDDGDRDYDVTLRVNQGSTADSVYDALAAVMVYATNADDDTAGVSVSRGTSSASPLRTTEAGGTDIFTVTLDSEPTGNVVLDVASSDTAQGVVDTDAVMNGLQSALTFTPSDWNAAQTVTLTGVDDDPGLPDGSQDYTVTLTVNQTNTADSVYDALASSPVTVYARNLDDELGLNVGSVTGRATEAGGTATFTVALQTQPSAAVTVTVESRDATGRPDTSEGTASPSELAFTPQNWSAAQTVTVTGADDDWDDGDVAWRVRLKTSSGGDADYDGLEAENVSVTTTDDDDAPTATLVLTPSTIDEGGTANTVATVTARLSHPSGAETTIEVQAEPGTGAVAGDYTLTGMTLTIAPGQIASTGTVTIAAVDNRVDAADKTVTVSGSATNDRTAADSTTLAVTGADLTIADDDEAGFAFKLAGEAVRGLDAPAGEPVAYTLALRSMPTGTVSVAVAAGNTSLTVSTASLTFAPDDWNTAQTVTVTARAGADDYANEASWVSYTASGGGYDEEFRLPVSVRGETAVRIKVAAGTTTYTVAVEGREVAVEAEAGVPEGIEIDLTGLGTGEPLTVTVKPLDDDAAAAAAGSGYSLGRAADSRVAVDVAVSDPDALSGGVRLCLPVTEGLLEAAAGRTLVLLRRGEPLDSEEVHSDEGVVVQLCAGGVASFSPFAVGYADARPDFTVTALAFTFTVDEDVGAVELPAAGGDPPIGYALSPMELPPGLRYDDEANVLSGTPTARFAEKGYVLTATDVDGQTATLNITIEVRDNLAKFRARLKRINESILPELSRAQWGSALEAVTGRLSAPGAGEALGSSLARALQAQEGRQDEDGPSWREVLAGRTFAVGLGAGGDGGMGGGPGFGGAVLWGGGSRRSLSLDERALDWSGELFSAHLGVDAPLGERLRGGLAASWFASEIEYTDRSGDAAIEGVHESRMTALHPYLGWSGSGGAQLWGALGYGAGEIEIADAEVVERFGVQKSDSEFLAAAAGGSVPVLSAGRLTLALKGSGEATRYSVEDNGNAIAAVSVATQRLRLSAEGSWAYGLAGGGSLTPSLELGGRWDAGDGETGAGLELGGGLEWTLPAPGLSVALSGRTLAAHGGKLEEWGASGSARLAPGTGGRGLSFALSPRWGAAESGIARLWNDGSSSDRANAAPASLDTELGYGFGVPGPGLLTPYGGFGYEQGGARRYRLGTRLGLGPAIDLGLEAQRKERTTNPEHALRLDLRIRW